MSRLIFLICSITILSSCNKESFRDERYSYCYKTSEDDNHWGCNNFIVSEKLSYEDSSKIHSYYDRNTKGQLKDTSFFISKIIYIGDESRFRAPRLKVKD
tara:strand:+ start:229 stop:528 length:300 start_codon:yes stop_codon:yes gene_type:complete